MNTATNFTRNTSSDADGSYRLASSASSTYDVSVEISGFAKELRKGILLNAGKEISLDFALKLSTAGETVEVTRTKLHWSMRPGPTSEQRSRKRVSRSCP